MVALLKISENQIINLDLVTHILFTPADEGVDKKPAELLLDTAMSCLPKEERGPVFVKGDDAERAWAWLKGIATTPEGSHCPPADNPEPPADDKGNQFASALQHSG